jgi:signal transduction histidine kinase
MRRFGLRPKLLLLIFGTFSLLLSISTYIQIADNTKDLRKNLNEQSLSFAKLATKPIGDNFLLYKDTGNLPVKVKVTSLTDQNPDIVGVTIVDTSGASLFSWGDKPAHLSGETAKTFSDKPFYNSNGEIVEIVSPILEDFGAHRYTIFYRISNQRINAAISQTVGSVFLWSGLVLVGGLLATYLVINSFLLRPLRDISTEAMEISYGNLDRQIGLRRNDELGDLARALNSMTESLKSDIAKLQETDRLKTEFMTITSHNLRTPLTIINGYLEEIKPMKMPEKLRGMLDVVAVNALRLENFTEDVLTISTMESGQQSQYDMAPTKIRAFLEALGEDFKKLTAQKQQSFAMDLHLQDEEVKLSRPRLKSAIWNLLDNAYKFTPLKGKIVISAEVQGSRVVLKVSDTGIGISKEEMPKLFTKFHRATGILNYDYEGTGIGLYITKLIVRDHFGTIAVESHEAKGTTFTIWLPLAHQTSDSSDKRSQVDVPTGLI